MQEEWLIWPLVVAWAPFFVLVGAYVVIVSRGSTTKRHEQMMAETQRTNTALERIASALEREQRIDHASARPRLQIVRSEPHLHHLRIAGRIGHNKT